MNIAGFQKLSMLDYPGLLAATVFTLGCNLRCPFCHNPLLVVDSPPVLIDETEVFGYLTKRKNVLGGVCITGGEPLLQANLEDFIEKVRSLGLKIKLDTNGCYPDKLISLVDKGLIDYVAMDIKNSLASYAKTVGVVDFDTGPVQKSVEFLRSNCVPYEFRTTLIKELHSTLDLEQIGAWLEGESDYFLQGFIRADCLVGDYFSGQPLTAFSSDEMRLAQVLLQKYVPKTVLRGI